MAVAPSEPQKRALAANRNVARLVGVVDQKRFVKELEQIRAVLSRDLEFKVHGTLLPGARVRVVSGRLKDMEGVVRRAGARTRLLIAIEMFSQAISVEINESELQALA
jgi:transcription antitermination factor NusG